MYSDHSHLPHEHHRPADNQVHCTPHTSRSTKYHPSLASFHDPGISSAHAWLWGCRGPIDQPPDRQTPRSPCRGRQTAKCQAHPVWRPRIPWDRTRAPVPQVPRRRDRHKSPPPRPEGTAEVEPSQNGRERVAESVARTKLNPRQRSKAGFCEARAQIAYQNILKVNRRARA